MKTAVRYILLLALIMATVFLVRLFVLGSYRITSNETGYTLKAGDYVLVNKLKNNSVSLRNRMILYKSPLRRDAVDPPLFLGRCIGVPGDMIQMGTDGFRVNGRLLPDAPMMQPTFRIHKNIKEHLLNTMEMLNIPFRDVKEDSVNITFRMSLSEKELLSQNLSKIVPIEMIGKVQTKYEFAIPHKGKSVDIDEVSLKVCREAIMSEIGDRAVIRDNKLYIDGEEQTYYFFNRDYYWILSENETKGIDSRHLGLIPASSVIGSVWYCWYSKDPMRRFKKIK